MRVSRFGLNLSWCFFFLLFPGMLSADPLCWLRSQSPYNVEITGPVELGPQWRRFKLTKPFKAGPSIQYVHLLLKKKDFDFVDFTKRDEFSESWNRWLPRHKQTGQIQIFDVRVHNSQLGWVDLVNSFTGSPTVNGEAMASLGFSNHPDSNRFFYPQASAIDELQIRASHPVTIEAIWWDSPGYWKWPCRKWSDVSPSQIMLPQN